MKQLTILIFTLLSLNLFGQEIEVVNLEKHFGSFTGGFSVYDLKTGKYFKYNPNHCKKGFSPCSSSKIMNSLIGLESGVIKDTSFVINYDSVLHPREKNNHLLTREPFKHWFEDLSLKEAFKYSCVWYYQELARRVGENRMKKYVEKIDYGNNDISSGLDTYWLCGSIKISIDEQIEFLKKLYLEKLNGFSKKNQASVKSIMLYEETENYRLYGKTGGGDCWNDKVIGWYVGFLETESGTKIFAMNIIVDEFKDFNNNFRIEITKEIFRELKMIE